MDFFACNVDLSTKLTEKCFVKKRKEEQGHQGQSSFQGLQFSCGIHLWSIMHYIYVETKYDT
jgi:hypothetical protein